MQVAVVVAACLSLVASAALAQYPARGLPDPAFNGGQLRVQPFSDPAAGVDTFISVAPLSSVRFAGFGQRPNADNDFVTIVDTFPERVVAFDTDFAAGTAWQALAAGTSVGSALVLAGALNRPGEPVRGVVQVREIGLKAVPTYAEQGTLIWTSTDTQRMYAKSTAVAARAGPGGSTHIWHARSQFDDNFTCGHSIVQRLDHAGAALVERGSVDLAASLSRVCMVAYYAIAHERLPTDPPNAEAIVIGASCRDLAGSVVYFCAARILDVGGALSIDTSFGASGLASYGAGSGFNYLVRDIRADGASRLVVALDKTESTGSLAQITGMLMRLDSSGRLDPVFGTGGTLDIPSGGVNRIAGLAVASNGTLQAVGGSTVNGVERPYAFYLEPVTRQAQFSRIDSVPANPPYNAVSFNGVTPLAAGGSFVVGAADTGSNVHALMARLAGDRQTVDLIEYFHAAFGHYFVASVLAEIGKLDDGSFAGWERTGESFAAYPTGAAGAADVCRFFSASFAPRSSHFYTPITVECEGLKSGGVWDYEGLVFALFTAPSGTCPQGARPLYRLYNQGQGGAPNHRYTTSDAIRTGQAAQGWIEEGNGTPPVFACLPT